MIKFLRSRNPKQFFTVDNDVLFHALELSFQVEGVYFGIKDEDGRTYLVFEGNGPYDTVCMPIEIGDGILLEGSVRKLFFEVIGDKIDSEKYQYLHYIVTPVNGAGKFLASYSKKGKTLCKIMPLPRYVSGQKNLIFDEQGEFIRPCL